jgi:hypothetical protein
MQLDAAHRTGLRSSLSLAERAIWRLEALLALAWPPAGPAPAAATRMRALAARFHAEIAVVRAARGLTHAARDIRPLRCDEIFRARDALEVSRPEELGGFGALDPATADALRPRIASLLILVRDLESAAGALPASKI